MGQQQVFLLVIVSIVVGLMTVVGIVLFERARDESFNDMLRQDIIDAGLVGQTYYGRPVALGGGGGTYVNITLQDIALDSSTVVGTFSITEATNTYFKITAVPTSGLDNLTAVIYSNNIEWE
ncbi:MAG: hypothetical protein MI700_01700 [Balneolales bacterium]|nr:hypothetical protein [Balneolales bacterium]